MPHRVWCGCGVLLSLFASSTYEYYYYWSIPEIRSTTPKAPKEDKYIFSLKIWEFLDLIFCHKPTLITTWKFEPFDDKIDMIWIHELPFEKN